MRATSGSTAWTPPWRTRSKPSSLTVRNLDMKRYDQEFDSITAIFNDAWKDNWSFIPFTEAEIRHMARSLKPLINPELVAIVKLMGAKERDILRFEGPLGTFWGIETRDSQTRTTIGNPIFLKSP